MARASASPQVHAEGVLPPPNRDLEAGRPGSPLHRLRHPGVAEPRDKRARGETVRGRGRGEPPNGRAADGLVGRGHADALRHPSTEPGSLESPVCYDRAEDQGRGDSRWGKFVSRGRCASGKGDEQEEVVEERGETSSEE